MEVGPRGLIDAGGGSPAGRAGIAREGDADDDDEEDDEDDKAGADADASAEVPVAAPW